MRYRNSSAETRVWPWLVDAGTGRTLRLEPGGEAEVSGDINDPHLQAAPDEPDAEVSARVKSPKSTTTAKD